MNINNFIKYKNTHKKFVHSNIKLGLWIYLMSDCIIFVVLFVSYFLNYKTHNFYPKGKDFFNLFHVFIETIILLLSSFTCSLSIKNINNIKKLMIWITYTLLLGIIFLVMEYYEFHHLFCVNIKPQNNSFLSSFFTIIAMHGFHVIIGLLWLIILIIKAILNNKIEKIDFLCFSIFWHFLDIVWIFVFSFVYLYGMI